MQNGDPPFPFLHALPPRDQNRKIPAVPLSFEHLPADIIAKEFTKLNNPHPYRIHYLGPRPQNSLTLHKRYGIHWDSPQPGHKQQTHPATPYELSLRKIVATNLMARTQSSTFFYRAFEGMNPTLTLSDEYLFSSAFEGGNLDCVVKVAPTEFDLFLRVDSNTHGHTGWYYFSVSNGSRRGPVTLHLCNLRRVPPLYEQGMSPFVYSVRAAGKGQQWAQGCSNVRFQQCPLRYDIIYERTDLADLYRLSFNYNFQHEQDEVFFAYCVPYSYSQLQQDIKQYCLSPYVKQYALGHSLTGLEIPLLHITQNQQQQKDQSDPISKQCVVVTARVHPCEANSSFLMRGLLQQLLGSSKHPNQQSQQLRTHTHFFLLPMLNPDGVVLGNTRTSAAGVDLNRQFLDTYPEMHPEVHLLKNFVAKLQRAGRVTLYLDLHGHSRRKNTFAYGPNYPLGHPEYLRARMLPKIIEKINPAFRYYSCSFTISQEKTKTARATMIHQLRVPYVYTVQSSAGLYYSPEIMKTLPFNAQSWEAMGTAIARAVAVFSSALLDFESTMKQRRAERDRRKEKDRQSPNKQVKGQLGQDQFQYCKTKETKPSLYMELLAEIKQTSNAKTFEDPTDSDDYDPSEDLSGPRLKQFKLLVTGYRKQYSPTKNIPTLEQDQDNFTVPVPELPFTDLQLFEEEQEQKPLACKSPRRLLRDREQFRSTAKTIKTIDPAASRKDFGSKLKTRKSVHDMESKVHLAKRQTAPISVYPPKPRYSLVPKNVYPLEEKFEALSIPNNLKAMRREMKKGRMLISSLEESRRKFMTGHHYDNSPEYPLKKKPSLHDVSRLRPALRSSSTHISGTVNLNEQVRLKPSQPYLHGLDNYVSLTGIDTDKLALTITHYKRRK